ncbi:MAG: hypothetical protein AB7Q23_02295 [Hyphomonadaceae bacterium]
MDRTRFGQLAEAYGADLQRWPAHQRAAAAAYAAAHKGEADAILADARATDAVLDAGRAGEPDTSALAGRILAQAPKRQSAGFDRRAMFALAACAVFGVLIGYGGGLLAPPIETDDAHFAAAFEAPFFADDVGDEG